MSLQGLSSTDKVTNGSQHVNNSGYKFVYLIDAPFPLVVLSAFSEYFVLDLSEKDNNAVPPLEDNDETMSVIEPEMDKTEYHEDTVVEGNLCPGAGPQSLQEVLANVYAHEEPVKRELQMSNKQKVIVTVDKLRGLIPGICKVCGEAITVTENLSGAVLSIKWNCCNGHSDSWSSSDVLTIKNNQKVYANNLQLSAAILLSGNNFTKFDLLAKFLSLETISESVFYRTQKLYCCPAIQNMWTDVKTAVHSYLSSSGVTVAGDGRNDSPGHTARYSVYTLMEETTKMIVDIEVIDKRETGGKSAAMEKLAMSRLLQRLKGVLTISHVVTDASTSIKALVRDMKGTYISFFSVTVILFFDTTGKFAKSISYLGATSS